MKLLAVSTSTPRASVALLDDDCLLATRAYVDLKGHAERIFGAIQDVVGSLGLGPEGIEAIGCDIGPGSFTGVRVGVSSCKGIALTLGIAVVGVTSLEGMAAAAFAKGIANGKLVVPMIDASRGEIFFAMYDDLSTPAFAPPQHIERNAAAETVLRLAAGRPFVVVGQVAEQIPLFRAHHVQAEAFDLPDALWIGCVASKRLRSLDNRADHNPAQLEPLYVRAPDAKPLELGYTPSK